MWTWTVLLGTRLSFPREFSYTRVFDSGACVGLGGLEVRGGVGGEGWDEEVECISFLPVPRSFSDGPPDPERRRDGLSTWTWTGEATLPDPPPTADSGPRGTYLHGHGEDSPVR